MKEAFAPEPFVPFTLKLASGQDAHFPHSEALLVPPHLRSVALWEDGGFRAIDLLLVEELRLGRERKPQRRAG
ncbi:MAG: hypothetical protein IT435_00825 [Phycisphaerales bacterium]|nr:hypothetical protein [Phycisphaerales bacterium]